jgi:hypothetical protein
MSTTTITEATQATEKLTLAFDNKVHEGVSRHLIQR